jgi:hypothetical protein
MVVESISVVVLKIFPLIVVAIPIQIAKRLSGVSRPVAVVVGKRLSWISLPVSVCIIKSIIIRHVMDPEITVRRDVRTMICSRCEVGAIITVAIPISIKVQKFSRLTEIAISVAIGGRLVTSGIIRGPHQIRLELPPLLRRKLVASGPYLVEKECEVPREPLLLNGLFSGKTTRQ